MQNLPFDHLFCNFIPSETLLGKLDALTIEHMDDLWVVSGRWLQQLISDINFADYESRMYFDRQLRKSGLFERLEQMGIEDGDTVSIYDFEFDYER